VGIRQTTETMNAPAPLSGTERTLLTAALILFLIIAVKMISYIINIFVISLMLTLLAVPATRWLRKKNVPNTVAAVIVVLIGCLFGAALILLTLYSFNTLVADIPLYQTDLNQRLAGAATFFSGLGFSFNENTLSSIDLSSIIQLVLSSLMSAGDAIFYLFFIIVTTFFMIIEAPRVADQVAALFPREPEKLALLSRMSGFVVDFIVVRTETNVVHGALFGGALYAMGIHAAVLWGLLTFFLCYIPYFGLIIAAIPAIFFAFLQYGVWGAVGVIAIVCVLNLIVENPVISFFAARRYEIPAIIVILSVIFWGWLLGLAGMLFAVPITIVVLIFVQFSDELRWINDLLGVSHLFEETNPIPGNLHNDD